MRDDRPKIYGDGKQSRDFVFIKDVVTATLAASEIPDANGEILNIRLWTKCLH